MKTSIAATSKKTARLSFVLGGALILVSLLMNLLPLLAGAGGWEMAGSYHVLAGAGDCGSGYVEKIGSPPFTYHGSSIITSIFIKAGSQTQGDACVQYKNDQNDGCYSVSGLGTTSVTVDKVGSGPECKDISHVEIYVEESQPPTATSLPPTPTATLQLEPPTPTATESVVTPTATATSVLVPPSPTATSVELVPPTPTATEIPATPEKTATSIILPPPPTNTGVPPETAFTPVPASSTPAGESRPPAATQVQPTRSGTLPPPSAPATGTQTTLLIPVSGGNLGDQEQRMNLNRRVFTNWSLGLAGLALLLYGVGSKLIKK